MVEIKDTIDQDPLAERDSIDMSETATETGQVLDLGTTLTIADITEWHGRFASAFERGSSIEINGAGIAQIDGAGVQLLVAIMKEAVARHVEISWSAVSETLREAVSQLGLKSVFNFQKDLP